MRKFLGLALSMIGAPAAYCMLKAIPSDNSNPIDTVLFLPLFLITSPLLPAALAGDRILSEESSKEFRARTKNLPRITLPTVGLGMEGIDIITSIDYDSENNCYHIVDGDYYIHKITAEFYNLQEAKDYLLQKNYVEVVDADNAHHLNTWFVKKEYLEKLYSDPIYFS